MSAPTSLFLYGTLRYRPLLEAVLGRGVTPRAARLADHSVRQVSGERFPILVPDPGVTAEGFVVETQQLTPAR